jgi:hypothetical protein
MKPKITHTFMQTQGKLMVKLIISKLPWETGFKIRFGLRVASGFSMVATISKQWQVTHKH